jgi:hypothetical protein
MEAQDDALIPKVRSQYVRSNYQEDDMKLKSALLAATLATFSASAVHADEDYPEDEYFWKGEAQTLQNPLEKPVKKKRRHTVKKTPPAADADKQVSVKDTAAKEAQAKEKREKEGCEKTLAC